MIINVEQSIHIQLLKIGGITNSSVLQIGTAGVITPASYLYNTAGIKAPAPLTVEGAPSVVAEELKQPSFVPL
ncbi:spore germination protein GerPB [Lederbergia citrea]|uniref:Spore gernimation protein n=1 Tax=Lederbergia citrea TaxID=2833581 RepID=A0A942Z1B3_9BACI|nr:spore germination protein GerPB [Lederbergia citrea]MBS4177429.1 spore gernimation protein [Lederbergia citrea]MBS4204107.1 spore gernimation protein [Lederbergia citrea]MBS4221308.1 spore gernimation protein [Lederbergia citrea]